MQIRTVLVLCVFFLALPFSTYAVDMEADEQCPPGGQVGQKCVDNTNGYQTKGHCTFIKICKADSFPKEPNTAPETQSPSGPNPYRSPIEAATPIPKSYYYSTSISSNILGLAFSEALQEEIASVSATTTGGYFFSIEGKEFLFEDDSLLVVGEPLTAADKSGLKEMPFDTSAFVAHVGLSPFPQRPGTTTLVEALPLIGGSPEEGATFGYSSNVMSDITQNITTAQMILYILLPLVFLVALPLALFIHRRRKGKHLESMDYSVKSKNISTKDVTVAEPLITGSQMRTIWEDKGLQPK